MRDAAYSTVKVVGDSFMEIVSGPSNSDIKRRSEIAEERRKEGVRNRAVADQHHKEIREQRLREIEARRQSKTQDQKSRDRQR